MLKNILDIDKDSKQEINTFFLERQIRQIKKGGWSILLQKIYALFFKIFCMLCSVPIMGVVLILRPFIVIRFGKLDISRIGAIYVADWYLSERAAGLHSKRYFDIFYFTTINNTICNQQWLKMWKRILCIFPFGNFASIVDKIQRKVLRDYHVVSLTPVTSMQNEAIDKYNNKLNYVLAYKKPHIFFTKEEEIIGQKALKEMGLLPETQFVGFHSRDSAYLDATYSQISWGYHDYRDSSIQNYIAAVLELIQRGYHAIRMGAVVKEKINLENPDVIDYALNGARTDFLDIYLGSKCKFFICSDVGISIIPEMFRLPVVYTNWVPLWRISPWVLNGLFIFKKLYLSKEKRFLSFREIIYSEFGNCEDGHIFKKLGIELIENSFEEIKDVVIEMDERLKGTWEAESEDDELQQRFWNLFGPNKLKSSNVRIGAEFLRENQGLLE